jgi:hypothetical protein
MKQLETLCAKKKGIVSQTVKDIAASLVSDDLIKSDKIGIGVFYWSFPSESLLVVSLSFFHASMRSSQIE